MGPKHSALSTPRDVEPRNPDRRRVLVAGSACAASLVPQPLKNSLLPPNVTVPMLNAGTLNPEPPNRLNSIRTLWRKREAA